MKHFKQPWFWLLIIYILLLWVDPVYAGPGGAIAKGLFKSWWGKILLSLIVIILLPLFFYVKIVETLKVRKNKKLLSQLSVKHPDFAWIKLQKVFTNSIQRVYHAWSNEDLQEVKNYVNHWYWQNQQEVFINQWKRENLKNVSSLKRISAIRPMYMELTEDLEGSRIAVAIDVEAEDYLKDLQTGKIVQGKSGVQDLNYIWFFEYTEGKWLLDEIQEGSFSLGLAKLPNVVSPALGLQTA